MLVQIVTLTPLWVWAILGLLLWVGLKQSLPRSVSLRRIMVLPVVMVGLSLAGTLTAFGSGINALLAWGAGAAVAAAVAVQRSLPPTAQYNVGTQLFQLPGTWTPLALMTGIFITKYAVGVALAMHPELACNAALAQGAAALYGGFSGVFLARAARLWRLAAAQAARTTVLQGV